MPIPGAKAVPAGALVSVRDVRNLRVKVLNSARLHASLVGGVEAQRLELDHIGATEDDQRTLLTRSLELLHAIARDDTMKPTLRWRAAKTITEALTTLRQDEQKGRHSAAELSQRSQEHADKVSLETRKLDLVEASGTAAMPVAAALPRAELERIAANFKHAAPPAPQAE